MRRPMLSLLLVLLAVLVPMKCSETAFSEQDAWMNVGLTFYNEPGSGLACGGNFDEEGLWAAVPIEWNQAGYVSCGDMLTADFGDGTVVTVPIRDFGCHLHYPAWGGDGETPYGADFPRRGILKELSTGLGRITVIDKETGEVWNLPPTTAWWRKDCCGPLTWEPPRPGGPRELWK